MSTEVTQTNSTDMSVVHSGLPQRSHHVYTVGDIVTRLSSRWAPETAETWDKTGLLAGDSCQVVTRACVALDVTHDAIKQTIEQDAQLLLTHHPAYLKLDSVTAQLENGVSGSLVYEAVAHHVALVNYHTALDQAVEAHTLLPTLLHARFDHVLVPTGYMADGVALGYGQVSHFDSQDVQTLDTLAARCMSVFGRVPRVWAAHGVGDFTCVATWNGSVDESAIERCVQLKIPVLICGEIKYHTALEAQQRGLSVIELGHDVSENPYTVVLARALCDCGLPKDAITIVQQDPHWYNPETRRV